MDVWILERDSNADSWTSAGRWNIVAVRETREECVALLPPFVKPSYLEQEYYYRISKWSTESEPSEA